MKEEKIMKNYDNEDIKVRINKLRRDRALSMNKFAKECGIDQGNLSKALRGKGGLSEVVLMKIAKSMKVSFEWLTSGCGLCGVEGNEQLDALSDDFNSKHSVVPTDVPSADAPKAEDAATFKDVLQFLSAGGIDAEGKISYKGLQDLIALQKELELKDEMLRQKDDEIAFLRNLLSQGK